MDCFKEYTIEVASSPSCFTIGSSLPGGERYVVYAGATLTPSDPPPGLFPFFDIIAGALPAGLSLAFDTGIISGTPTAFGTFNFTVRLRDFQGVIVTLCEQPMSVVIDPGECITPEDGTWSTSVGEPNGSTADVTAGGSGGTFNISCTTHNPGPNCFTNAQWSITNNGGACEADALLNYTFSIDENTPAGTAIATFRITIAGEDEVHTYETPSGSPLADSGQVQLSFPVPHGISVIVFNVILRGYDAGVIPNVPSTASGDFSFTITGPVNP